MYLGRLVAWSVVVWSVSNVERGVLAEDYLLERAINALHNGLEYMENHMFEINLDGAFGCKLVYDLLRAFLESRSDIFDELGDHLSSRVETLADKSGRIADKSKRYVKINEPVYYENVGGLIDKSETLMWFPDRFTKPSLVEEPLPCATSTFNETFSDSCLREILLVEERNKKNSECIISEKCLDVMTKPRGRGYLLTHQVLYFQILQMHKCDLKSLVKSVPELLHDTLCSNVMRDAEEISKSGYPLNHHDLFMEQIGLCGLWGYRDFYKPSWLREILSWQQTSGCFANRAQWHCTEKLPQLHLRRKRTEKVLKEGCLSHKTAVALLAIAANTRFIIEEIFELETMKVL